MEWADKTILRLRELWAEGHSTAEIGRRLGVSKNSIVGKAHRLELPARHSPIRREGERPPPPTRPGVPRRLAGPTLPPPSGTSLGSTSLGSTSLGSPSLGGMSSGGGSFAPAQPAVSLPPRPPVVVAPRPAPSPPRAVLPQTPPPRPYGRVITCCWPIGEPRTRSFRFCDLECVPGNPYCQQHAQMAYVKVKDRATGDD